MSNSAHAVPERRKPSSTLCGQDTTEEFTDELTQSILYTFYKAEITMKWAFKKEVRNMVSRSSCRFQGPQAGITTPINGIY